MLFRGITSCRSFYRIAESLVIVGVVFFFCSYSACVHAGQATLSWDANTESILGGYQLHYGQTSGNYTANVDVGNKTSHTLASLQDGVTYYFALKAHDTTGIIWSDFSNEVSATITSTTSTAPSAPSANFSASPTSGTAPLTVTFTDSSTGSITAWSWNFGDGTTSTAKNAAKSYSNSGTYTVELTVTGSGGSNTATKSNYISVTAPPVATTPTTAGNNGLVAAYNFEDTGSSNAIDISGQGNHGTLKGATQVTTGRFGKALAFDGINDWVTINDAASLDLTTGMTLEAWVFPTTSSGTRDILIKEGAGVDIYNLYARNWRGLPEANIFLGGINQTAEEGGAALAPNVWTHLAGTYDGTSLWLFVNGTEVARTPMSGLITTSAGPLRIGGNSLWGEFFKGRIDEVRVYNRALSATEINTDMDTAVGTSSPPIRLVGTDTIESVLDYNPEGMAQAFGTQAEVTGTVTSLWVYVDAASSATQLVAGLYADNNGHPSTLIAQGTLSSPGSGGWKHVPIPPASIKSGSPYWIAVLGPSGVLRFRDGTWGSGVSETSAQTTLTTLPGTWTTGTIFPVGLLSAYGVGYE